MELNFFSDSNQRPRPRHEVEITDISASPYSDGRRLRVHLQLTPFLPSDRPNITITAVAPDGHELSNLSIVETLQNQIDVTLHLKTDEPHAGTYTIQALLYYDEDNVQHSLSTQVTLPDDIPVT